MKHLVTIAFISTCLFSFGQSNMFWNNYSNFNPAMSGFQYKQHGIGTYTNYFPSLSGTYSFLHANYGMKIANNHGVGISYIGDFNPWSISNRVSLNYNYQFNLKRAGKLSLGTGMGLGRYQWTPSFPFFDSIVGPTANTRFELNLGIAYQWKNLFIGFSTTNLNVPKQDPTSSYYGPSIGYNVHAQYAFEMGNKFQLTPRVLYTTLNGFQQLRSNLTVTYLRRFSLGVSMQGRDSFGVNMGWDIRSRFRVAYMYSVTVSKLNNGVSGGVHDFTIGYVIKNKRVICGFRLEPEIEP